MGSISKSAFRDPAEVSRELAAYAQATGTVVSQALAEQAASAAENSVAPTATGGMESHLLFGHSGNMASTAGMKSKAYVAANAYFFQDPPYCVDPAKPDRTRITTEKFYQTGAPQLNDTRGPGEKLTPGFVRATKQGPDRGVMETASMYSTVSKLTLAKESAVHGLETMRKPRVKGEFTKTAA